jgi:hypothetical protein
MYVHTIDRVLTLETGTKHRTFTMLGGEALQNLMIVYEKLLLYIYIVRVYSL